MYDRNLTPTLSHIKSQGNIIGLGNNEMRTYFSVDTWCEEIIPEVKRNVSERFVLIASIMEGVESQYWQETAIRLEDSGVDMIEMNVSCPHGAPQKYRGLYINDEPSLLSRVIESCKDKIKIPVIVKINAHCLSLIDAIHACEQGGADGISATNTLLALPSIDIYRQAPGIPNNSTKYSTLMGYSGAGIRPFGLSCIAQIAQNTSLPVSGIGGIESWENCIEYFLIGASTIQVCTSAMISGVKIVDEFMEGVSNYLKEYGKSSIRQIERLALSYLVSPEQSFSVTPTSKAQIDYDRCIRCGDCITSCQEGARSAIILKNERITIEKNICNGCGLCNIVCPVNAIMLEPQE